MTMEQEHGHMVIMVLEAIKIFIAYWVNPKDESRDIVLKSKSYRKLLKGLNKIEQRIK